MSRLRNIIYPLLLAGMLSALAGPSEASVTTGNITGITVTNWGQVAVFETSSHPGRPACATAVQWDFNVSTAAGQAILSTLLTAYSLGKAITFTGTGVCDIESNVESISYVFLQN